MATRWHEKTSLPFPPPEFESRQGVLRRYFEDGTTRGSKRAFRDRREKENARKISPFEIDSSYWQRVESTTTTTTTTATATTATTRFYPLTLNVGLNALKAHVSEEVITEGRSSTDCEYKYRLALAL
uniref:Uncharacterized protein n=1 Tax=Vespula pensylvanica TaxID=30213 RepID=A0A834JKJ5_VESPE|nr:hypothetical protein H0235_017670 [Vespula pensylvanica]